MKSILKNITLLYAEDDLEVQKQMLEYFETFFKKIYVVSQGDEALEVYKKYKPELMIVDIFMPELDGLALAELIRKDDYKTKIVILSAHSQAELTLKAVNINVNHYLVKPASLQKMKEMMDKISQEFMRDFKYIVSLGSSLHYDKIEKKLISNTDKISLTNKEQRVLEILIQNIGKTVSIYDIGDFVWDEPIEAISNESIKMQVSNLRKKLPDNLITNVYGVGYMLKV